MTCADARKQGGGRQGAAVDLLVGDLEVVGFEHAAIDPDEDRREIERAQAGVSHLIVAAPRRRRTNASRTASQREKVATVSA